MEKQHKVIPFKEASRSFKEHLDKSGNNKILFSGAFGTGKTTFLKEFFSVRNGSEEENDNYEVFHLFPVNYTVAANEDIFRYIKTELLFLLLEKGIEFDKESFKTTFTAPAYIGDNALNILLPFIRLIPLVGKNVHDILKDLLKLKGDFESFNAALQIDDKERVKEFIKELYEREGSIYEDNFYSQLICQLLEKSKRDSRQTVLIIDDLDRIDPEHIFRILNVFAAHFDQGESNGGRPNKFGFDRVILVCHYENLKKIFQHKYGIKTDFSGYIDKYFSHSRFDFDSRTIIHSLIKEAFQEKKNDNIRVLEVIMNELADEFMLTIREAIKLTQGDLRMLAENSLPTHLMCIKYFCLFTDIDSLIERFQHCKSSVRNRDKHRSINYPYLFKEAVADLLFYNTDYSDSRTNIYSYTEKGLDITINVGDHMRGRQVDPIVVKRGEEEVKEEFSRDDYFHILSELAALYKRLTILSE